MLTWRTASANGWFSAFGKPERGVGSSWDTVAMGSFFPLLQRNVLATDS